MMAMALVVSKAVEETGRVMSAGDVWQASTGLRMRRSRLGDCTIRSAVTQDEIAVA